MPGPQLAVLMPVYNEQEALAAVVEEWLAQLRAAGLDFRVLLVDDGSCDATPEVLAALTAAHPELHVVRRANAGHGQSCVWGYAQLAAAPDGERADWVLQVDSDGQCDPGDFAAVWAARATGGVRAVLGRRRRRQDGPARSVISAVLRLLVLVVTGTWVPDPNVPYRLVRSEVLAEAVAGFPREMNLANVLVSVVLVRGLGPDLRHVPISFRARQGGRPSVRRWRYLVRAAQLLVDLVRHRAYLRERVGALRHEVVGVAR